MTKVNRRKQYEDAVPLKERMVPWLFLSPSLFFVSIIVLIPLLDAFRRSFFMAASDRFVGFQNYLAVLRNHAFKMAAAGRRKYREICRCLHSIVVIHIPGSFPAFVGLQGNKRYFQNLLPCTYGNTSSFHRPFVARDLS